MCEAVDSISRLVHKLFRTKVTVQQSLLPLLLLVEILFMGMYFASMNYEYEIMRCLTLYMKVFIHIHEVICHIFCE